MEEVQQAEKVEEQPTSQKYVPPEVHQHPCICDVKKYQRKALSREDALKKCKLYLRDPKNEAPEEITPTEKAVQKAEKLKEQEKKMKLRLKENAKKLETKGLVVQTVKDSDYKMQYRISFEEDMAAKKGRINYKKPPIYTIKETKSSTFRKGNRRYCGRIPEFLKPKPKYYWNPNPARGGYALPPPPPQE